MKREIFPNPEENEVTFHFNYLDKVNGWYINNTTAVAVDMTTSEAFAETVADLSLIVPKKADSYGISGKKLSIRCDFDDLID
ncbi:MAG: hypothetical protein AB7O96_08900 [Pseudobdellovibrionaceae bacterium]